MKKFEDRTLFKRNYYVVSKDGKFSTKIDASEVKKIKEAGKYEFCVTYVEGVRKFDYFTLPCKIVVEEIDTHKRYFELT